MAPGDKQQFTCPVCGGRLNWAEETCPVCAAREQRNGPQRVRKPSRAIVAVTTIGVLCIAARFLIPDAQDAASTAGVRVFWAKNVLTFVGVLLAVAAALKHARSRGP